MRVSPAGAGSSSDAQFSRRVVMATFIGLFVAGLVVCIAGGVLMRPVERTRFLRENGALCLLPFPNASSAECHWFAPERYGVTANDHIDVPLEQNVSAAAAAAAAAAASAAAASSNAVWFVGVACRLEYAATSTAVLPPPPDVIVPAYPSPPPPPPPPRRGLPDFAQTVSYLGIQACDASASMWTLLSVYNATASAAVPGGIETRTFGSAYWSDNSSANLLLGAVLLLGGLVVAVLFGCCACGIAVVRYVQ